MKPRYRRFNDAAQAFFDEVERAIAASEYSSSEISTRAGRSRSWLAVHRYYGHPWQAYIIDAFCKGAAAPEETRLRLHRLAVTALGYEV